MGGFLGFFGTDGAIGGVRMLVAGSERMLAKDMGSFALTGFYVVN